MSGEALNPTDFASAVTAITSAFGDPTRREIYLLAHETPLGLTASGVAEHFDLHANVARHHLDKLVSGGYLEIAVARTEGRSAGRPSKHYRAIAPTINLDIAVRHDDILVSLLGKALSRLDPADAAELAEEVGIEYGRQMAAAMGDTGEPQRSFRSALHAVADALSAHGFAAHAEQHGDQLRIVSDHCPFGDTAIEHPVICAVDRGMVKGMLGSLYGSTDPEIESSVALGATQCVTAVDA
ncbi:MAG: helix-turn-helix domain-containing protein [Acidimicrobiia bacterium]|nr:helix-turn-helix domain-containing protein [Acidimicrobiia bacterium]